MQLLVLVVEEEGVEAEEEAAEEDVVDHQEDRASKNCLHRLSITITPTTDYSSGQLDEK